MSIAVVFFVQLCIFFSLLCDFTAFTQGPIVNTTLGQVRGVVSDDGTYTMFLGIPFGRVNESNPFGVALPFQEFDGIFEAVDDSAICPQQEEFNNTITGTLDCLHLNIHVPNTASPTNPRPVLVSIFGGGFTIGFYGTYLYGPKYLVRHDILLVTINYRVGPFGFMCLDIPEVPGNQGLKDQLMALRWIHDNINNFGGDPNRITIQGNSAGGISVEHQMIRKNNGPKLFHQGILQSGTSFLPGNAPHAKDAPIQLARHLGFDTNDIYEALSILARVDPLLIIESSLQLNLGSGVCVEQIFENVEGFVTEDMTTITVIPEVLDMPILIGFNNDELYARSMNVVSEEDLNEVVLLIALFVDYEHPDFECITNNVRSFYFGDDGINDDQVQNYVDFLGDISFVYPTFRAIKRFLENDVGNMYLYKFSYDGERNFVKHRENYTGGGAYHADELGYMFDISYMGEPNPEDQRVLDATTAMWANFVIYGDPTPETSQLLPLRWNPVTKSSYTYMDIDLELRVGNRPFRERMVYWDLIFDSYVNNHSTLQDNRRKYQFTNMTNNIIDYLKDFTYF